MIPDAMNASSSKTSRLVDNTEQFSSLCRQWRAAEYLALDTEFIRTNTFYSKLGLLQIADSNACYLIDPLCITDWTKFSSLLSESECCFVIHSCSEDLNLLFTFLKVLPVKVFDTQLAAAFLDMGYSVSYQMLVNELLGIELAKDETRSDWLRRPLSASQLSYAAADVQFLLEIQKLFQQQLADKGVLEWFYQECEQRLKIAPLFEDQSRWQSLYASISNAWRLSDKGLQILQQLCYWREQEARHRNKPRSWIAKDLDLLNIAIQLSEAESVSSAVLLENEHIDKRLIRRYSEKFLALAQGHDSDFIEIDRRLINTPLTPPLRRKLKSCQSFVTSKAQELAVAPELLGRKKQLQELIRSYENTGELCWEGELSGWRRQILDADISRILLNTA